MSPSNDTAGSRAISSLLDQAMSSASNGLVVFAVARVGSVDAFGAASLFFACSAAAMGVGRGALGTPIMLAAGLRSGDQRREAELATTAALTLGLTASTAVALSSLLLGVPSIGAAFAIAIPLLIVVDVFRYSLIAASRPNIALIWDSIWTACSAVLFATAVLRPQTLSDVAIVLGWAGSAAVSALGMASNLGLRPRFRGISRWWRQTWASRLRYGLEASLSQINAMITTSIATVVVGAPAAASLRGASALLAPLPILLNALPLVVIPEAIRSGVTPTAVWRRLCRIGIVVSLIAIALGPSLRLLPEHAGEFFLGESWSYAKSVLPIVSLEYAFLAWGAVALSLLRFQGRSGQLLAASMGHSVISVIFCITAALLTGTAVGVAWGLAASAVVKAALITLYARPARE